MDVPGRQMEQTIVEFREGGRLWRWIVGCDADIGGRLSRSAHVNVVRILNGNTRESHRRHRYVHASSLTENSHIAQVRFTGICPQDYRKISQTLCSRVMLRANFENQDLRCLALRISIRSRFDILQRVFEQIIETTMLMCKRLDLFRRICFSIGCLRGHPENGRQC